MLNGILSGLILPAILFALGYIAYRVVLVAKGGLPWQTKRKSPFTSHFLRAPGHSVYEKVEELRADLMGHMLGVMVFPPIILATKFVVEELSGRPRTPLNGVILLIFGTGVVIYFFIKLYRTTRELKKMRLGHEAEVAVGQELNHLMRFGFHVYHDLPADGFNIDHVVIGPTGVYAVETKGRSKAVTGDGEADAKVIVDGDVLIFPHWVERKPVQQARRQAIWLSKWLSSAVGEKVTVVPVLSIPGWYTVNRKQSDVKLFFGKNPEKFFPIFNQAPPLSDSMIKRIVHQVDARCRDVESKAYLPLPSKMTKGT